VSISSPAADAVARLRRLVPRLVELGGDGEWLAERLQAYLDPFASLSADEAMGLVPAAGAEHWRTVARRAMRNQAIRALAGYFPGLNRSGTAEEIATMLTRYAATRWRVDRARPTMPDDYRGTARAYVWATLAAAGGRVPSARLIRQILAIDTPLLSARKIADTGGHDTSSTNPRRNRERR
jgi:hypothetical protein